MADSHGHHHHHGPLTEQVNKAFVWGIGLNLLFVIVEAAAGWYADSLALLTDAGHNLSDVGALGLSLLAFRLARVQPNSQYSYGYRKFTVLASLANGLLLLLAVGAIGWEAIHRLSTPPEVPGNTVALVAGIGILINTFTAWLFFHDRDKDLNIKGAYLHLAADAAVSVAVVGAGLTMQYTGWRWIDPAISFGVLAVILWSTWGLLRDSIRLSLDGVPPNVQVAKIREAANGVSSIKDIHHIHVWAMSTTETALTAHIVVRDDLSPALLSSTKHEFRHALEHLGIQHATLEVECESEDCGSEDCG
ncbi:MAG: cation transporter [Lewinellaceae bacterium]|nr:cation transporter [Lewinellaceae bacterium]